MSTFTWLPFFEEMLSVICEKYDKQTLRNVFYELFSGLGATTDVYSDGTQGPFREVDPLSFVAYFNRTMTDQNRKSFCDKARQRLNLKSPTPEDFNGIPTFHNMSTWFICHEKDRQPGDCEVRWEFARQINENRLTNDTFVKVYQSKYVGLRKTTMVMYICKPRLYLSLDGTNQEYLKNHGFENLEQRIMKASIPFDEYKELIREVQEKLQKPFYEISYTAWLTQQNKHADEKKSVEKEGQQAASFHISEYLFISDDEFQRMVDLLTYKKNIILQGPPGVGKTFIAKRLAIALAGQPDRVQLVQFHPSYSYEDFIQGYRPDGRGGFALRNGAFYEFVQQAQKDPDNNFVFIIDEINRGNLSKIFGELMLLIEPDKRSKDYAVSLTYSSPDEAKFYIPQNVFLIGTMNTADRSLALVDYALRRRFVFVTLSPRFESPAFSDYLQSKGASPAFIQKIVARMSALNKKICEDQKNLGPGYQIGHSFFCPLDNDLQPDERWYRQVIEYEIRPLLEEYWFDDMEKVNQSIQELLA